MATTVTPAATASFQLGPFDTLTLSSGGARGSIALTSAAPKLCADQTLTPQNGTFGPWGVPMSVVMTITQGACDYTVNVQSLTAAAAQSLVSGAPIVAAPATLDGSNVATYNGAQVSLAAAGTLTVSDAAWAGLAGGLTIHVGQGGTATLAFSGTATKENSSGSSATSVTLAASGVYVLLQSPTGTPKFRLTGGASL